MASNNNNYKVTYNEKEEIILWCKIPEKIHIAKKLAILNKPCFIFQKFQTTNSLAFESRETFAKVHIDDKNVVVTLSVDYKVPPLTSIDSATFDINIYAQNKLNQQYIKQKTIENQSLRTIECPLDKNPFLKMWKGDWHDVNSANWAGYKCNAIEVVVKLERNFVNPKIDSSQITKRLHIEEFYLSGPFSDVEIICENHKFAAHRIILSSASPVFKRMLEAKMEEAKTGKIVIKDMKPTVLKLMLKHIYTGNVEIHSFAGELLKAADKYDMTFLKDECVKKLLNDISTENAMELYSMGLTYNSESLRTTALEVLRANKIDVADDCQTFQELVSKFPDVMFDLFKNQNY